MGDLIGDLAGEGTFCASGVIDSIFFSFEYCNPDEKSILGTAIERDGLGVLLGLLSTTAKGLRLVVSV
jgi:hypothetical protein